jgi:hypothetical protein
MKNIIIILALVLLAGIGIKAFSSFKPNANNAVNLKTDKKIQDSVAKGSFVKDYNVYALELPKKMDFAGEAVPLENPDIRERLDRELLVNTYWQSNGLLMIKRAHKYFPLIEKILKEENVPDDFKYLAVAESGLQQVVSPAGAVGFWQQLDGTAREYGLEVNDNVDERYHIEKETRSACKYLKSAKEKFGTWTLAAAAYNAGRTGIIRQQNRQHVYDYYDLLLNNETERYVFRILAIKEILSHAKEYGFNFSEDDLYDRVPTRKVKVDTVVDDFGDFAKDFGINYKILKLHNPWLREAHLNNASRREYEIKIPEEGYYTYKPE